MKKSRAISRKKKVVQNKQILPTSFSLTRHFHSMSDALRLPFLLVSLLPALAAGAYVWHNASMDFESFALAAFAVLLAHAGTNLANDYFDYLAGNYPDRKKGPTGGSFAIQHGLYMPWEILSFAILCFLVSMAIFLYLFWTASALFLPLGMAGIMLGFFYTAPPLKFGYRVMGEVSTFIGMGPLLFATVYLAGAGILPDAGGWLLSAFLGTLVLNVLLAAQVPDVEVDRASGKNTISVLWGVKVLNQTYAVSGFLGAAALLAGSIVFGVPMLALAGLVSLYFTLKAYMELEADRPLKAIGLSMKALLFGAGLVILALFVSMAFA